MRAEKESGKEIKVFKTDGGGEYIGGRFESYLKGNAISHSVSPPYTPKHNGLAERANRTLMESARCMMADASLEKSFWGFAVATAAHIHNRLPSRSPQNESPLEFWTAKPPSIGHLRTFGSATYTLIAPEKRKKLDPRSQKCILLGYDEEAGTKVYRVYDPATKRIFSSRDVIIDELAQEEDRRRRDETLEAVEISSPEIKENGTYKIPLEIAPEPNSQE